MKSKKLRDTIHSVHKGSATLRPIQFVAASVASWHKGAAVSIGIYESTTRVGRTAMINHRTPIRGTEERSVIHFRLVTSVHSARNRFDAVPALFDRILPRTKRVSLHFSSGTTFSRKFTGSKSQYTQKFCNSRHLRKS